MAPPRLAPRAIFGLCLWACACALRVSPGDDAALPDGSYLLRLLFVSHGFSCANVPRHACTRKGERLTPEGMGKDTYEQVTAKLDELLKHEEPNSMVGMNFSWGIKPRGWPIPGFSETRDNRADDCLLKVRNETLVDDQYDESGNLVALRRLVRDPHVTACGQQTAKVASRVLARWLEAEGVRLDLVGSSSLMRTMETAELVYARSPCRAALERVKAITVLPYVNEKREHAAFQPENFPRDPAAQERLMHEQMGNGTARVSAELVDGPGAYPREDQQWDKFKAVLALEVLPRLVAGWRAGFKPNPELVAALEAGRAEGKPELPEHSGWPQVDDPVLEVAAGSLRYLWQAPVGPSKYDSLKMAGSRELVLGISSHASLLGDACLEGKGLPNDLAVLEKRIAVVVNSTDGKTEFKVSEVAGPCRPIMEAPRSPEPGTLAESDLGDACKTPFNLAPFMDLAPEPSEGQDSACVTAGKLGFRIVPPIGSAKALQGDLSVGFLISMAVASTLLH